MPSPGLGHLTLHLQSSDLIFVGVYYQNIVEVIAKSPPKHIDFILIHGCSVAPSSQKGIILHLSFLPLQSFDPPCFKVAREINRVNVAEAAILGMAACNYEKLIAYLC